MKNSGKNSEKPETVQADILTPELKESNEARNRWIAKNSYPLVPEAGLSLVSLTGQDYPKLRQAFTVAWQQMPSNDRNHLLKRWRKAKDSYPGYPSVPWIVALPSWPCRDKDEFALTHPSGYSIRFIGPLFEIMPDEIAVGLATRELAYAYCLAGNKKWPERWAAVPRRTWASKLEWEVSTFMNPGFDKKLQAWICGNEQLEELSGELEAHAFLLFDSIGEDARHIFS